MPDQRPPTATRAPGRVAVGCIFLFITPFFLVGAFVVVEAFRQTQRGLPLSQTLPLFLVGTLFAAVAVLIALVAKVGLRDATRAMGARKAHPNEPWLWRADWMHGEARDQLAPRAAGMVVFAILWNAMSAVFTVAIVRDLAAGRSSAALGLLFPLVGVALLIAAWYQSWRRHKYGVSVCRLPSVPIEPGKTFRAEVDLHVTEPPENGFDVELACIRRTTRRGSRTVSYDDEVIWRAAERTPAIGNRLPVTFAIPADGEPSGEREFAVRVLWRLRVTAEVPGIDYAAEFELPVFTR